MTSGGSGGLSGLDLPVGTYSTAEMDLIRYFRYEDLSSHVEPPALYRMMVEKAFLDDDRSIWSVRLRKAQNALNSGTVYRKTPEFEKLLKIEIADEERISCR